MLQGFVLDMPLPDSLPDLTCPPWMSLCRYTPSMPRRQLFGDVQRDRSIETDHIYLSEHMFNCSNFLDLDSLSSSGNSCEEEQFER
jgi:hypothetical protein